MGGGKKEAQSVHPAPGGRGDQGLGPSSLAPTCLLYPCLHWDRASRRVQELTGGGSTSPGGRVHCTDSVGPERTGVHTPVLLVC